MQRFCVRVLTVIVFLALAGPAPAGAQTPLAVANDRATPEFPERLTFNADLQGQAEIQRVVLEYGVDQLTCSQVVAKAFPDFTPGLSVSVAWTWEMRQSGSLPPGAQIWWRWRVTEADGRETVTETQTTLWLDADHAWQTVSGGGINLHWYSGGASFGRQLHDSAVRSLAALERSTGLSAEAPVDLYIYANTDDMRAAVLYEPGWTGGLAYPAHDVVIIGIAPEDLAWGQRTQAHELTHVLVGHRTFSCLGVVPTWLNEGLAVYGEGGPDAASLEQFDAAVAADTVLSVRALSGGFSEDPAQADLSYSQSYRLTQYLIDAHGQPAMLDLLGQLRDGATVDAALQAVYGFDVDGFEAEWRAALGLAPRQPANATPTPVPSAVPTLVPVAALPAAIGATATPAGAAAATPAPAAASANAGLRTGALIALGVILVAGLGLGGAALVLAFRPRRQP